MKSFEATMKFSRFLISLVLVLVIACEFEPSGEFFKEVAQPDSSSVVVDLTEPNQDTVGIVFNTKFLFRAVVEGRTVIKTNVFMNNQLVTVINGTQQGEFVLSNNSFPEGIYRLRLELHCSSGTGSLADKSGAEIIVVNSEWVAVVDKTAPLPVNITSVELHDGSVEIHWQKYPRYNFQSYVLEKAEYVSLNDAYLACWSEEISVRDRVVFRDQSYAGGKVRYRLRVKAADKFSETRQMDFNDNYDPSFQYEWIDLKTVKLTWRKPRAYKDAVYELLTFNGVYNTIRKNNSSDTTYIYEPNVSFGGSARSSRLTIRGSNTSCYPMFRDVHVRVGAPFPQFHGITIRYNKLLNKYFAIQKNANNRNNLVRINATSLAVEQSFHLDAGSFGISNNGQYLYATNENALYQLDPATFQVLNTYDLSSLKNALNRQFGGTITVSNDNLVALPTALGSFVLRMPDFTVLYETADNDQSISLSSDGNFLVCAGKVWQRNGNSFDEKLTLGGILVNPVFRNEQNVFIVTINPDLSRSLVVVDLSTFTASTKDFSGHPLSVSYDPESGYVGYFKDAEDLAPTDYYLLNSAGVIQKTLRISTPQTHYSFYTILINNQLICSEGYAVPLSYFP